MGCDMVVALGRATVDGHTLFGQNSTCPSRQGMKLKRTVGRSFTVGETVHTQNHTIPQARQTYTAIGLQPDGAWGMDQGVNERQVAVGVGVQPAGRLALRDGLTGPDLVRLTLERSPSARQGVELLTDLIETHGQGGVSATGDALDHAFLIADPNEAFVVEASGSHWVYQEVQEVRAVSNVRIIRQDWNRISSGLGEHAIKHGWWSDDGSKVDFARALGDLSAGIDFGLRRWGRATLLLEQQNGHIDAAFVRRLLMDHYEGSADEIQPLSTATGPMSICCHAAAPSMQATGASLVMDLASAENHVPVAWCSFGPPCSSVALPLLLTGDLPEALTCSNLEPSSRSLWWRMQRLNELFAANPRRWQQARAELARLQSRLDAEVAEFVVEVNRLRRSGDRLEVERQTSLFMQHNVENLETVLADLNRSAFPGAKRSANLAEASSRGSADEMFL